MQNTAKQINRERPIRYIIPITLNKRKKSYVPSNV